MAPFSVLESMDISSLIFQQPLGYLVRCACTDAESNDIFTGWSDPHLNEEGRQACEALANYFAWERVGRIICSDLIRSVETAQCIIDTGNVANPFLSIDPSLRPWHIGEMAGEEKGDLKEFRKYIFNPDMVVPGGESIAQFRNRNLILMEYLAQDYQGLPTVLVTDESNIAAMMTHSFMEDAIKPGGIIAVYLIDNQLHFAPRLGAIEEEK